MKVLLMTLLFCPAVAMAEVVNRWTDSDGRVHYGDQPPHYDVHSQRQLVIEDTYDESAYQAAVKRYALYEKEQEARRKRQRRMEQKRLGSARNAPLTESDKYDLYMERQDEMKREELRRKRERRADSRRKWRLDCYDPANAGKKACR